MGLFDFFKTKENAEGSNQDLAPDSYNKVIGLFSKGNHEEHIFDKLKIYIEYFATFVSMQNNGNYSPIAAMQYPSGEIDGFLYYAEDVPYTTSVSESIDKMQAMLSEKLHKNEIKSYVVFYHSQYAYDDNHSIANVSEEFKAITAAYAFANGTKGSIAMPYFFHENRINYKGFNDFSEEENNQIFNTSLSSEKDYFKAKEKIFAPSVENEAGLKITLWNTLDLVYAWCGIFGFENYREKQGKQLMIEHFAFAMTQNPIIDDNGLKVFHLTFDKIIFKALNYQNQPKIMVPVVATDYIVDVVNSEIYEWANVDNLVALIKGSGRDTFSTTYLATDYAENRDLYLSKKELNIKISGIAFVLDESKTEEDGYGNKFSKDFTAYFPSKDIRNYGCYDFIGALEDVKEVSLLLNNQVSGYVMKIRLITNTEVKDFFTIDMFVSRENMRISDLTIGMKLSGMFQMQGCIAL